MRKTVIHDNYACFSNGPAVSKGQWCIRMKLRNLVHGPENSEFKIYAVIYGRLKQSPAAGYRARGLIQRVPF